MEVSQKSELEIDDVTAAWMFDESDKLAVAAGCRFDEECGLHAVWFIENVLYLYEGDAAGQPFKLMPYAYDFVMRLFGWRRWSKKAKRWIRRFRKAFLWVPKKNGKTPLLAAIELYLLTSDGEEGQKVAAAARDGTLADLAYRHAEIMAMSSPVLAQYLRLNKTKHRILFPKRNSFLFRMSGDNVKSQEGFNGTAGFDEMHVVDAHLWHTVQYAGISRSEGLIFGVSTAGADVTGIGKKVFDYGESVAAGKDKDTEFLHVCYQIPKEATDEELMIPEDATEEEIERRLQPWKDANPGWGITIDPEEMLKTIRFAQKSTFEFAEILKYRGNRWQTGDTPYLKESDWKACKKDYAIDDLKNCSCYFGIDAALIWDFAAVSFVFPWGKTDDARRMRRFRTLNYLFITEAGFEELASHVMSAHEWKASGQIVVTPGSALDEETFMERILWGREQFDVRGGAYDQMFAGSLAQRLQDTHGFLMQRFNQNGLNYLAPVEYFEQAVIGHTLEHNGNQAVDWMRGNVRVIPKFGGKLLDKPSKGDWNKIDAFPAMVMGMAMCMANPQVDRNWYETHELESG